MKKLLFLVFPLVISACSSGPLSHNECEFACMNEGHTLRKVEQNTCLCEFRDKEKSTDHKMPVVPEKAE